MNVSFYMCKSKKWIFLPYHYWCHLMLPARESQEKRGCIHSYFCKKRAGNCWSQGNSVSSIFYVVIMSFNYINVVSFLRCYMLLIIHKTNQVIIWWTHQQIFLAAAVRFIVMLDLLYLYFPNSVTFISFHLLLLVGKIIIMHVWYFGTHFLYDMEDHVRIG